MVAEKPSVALRIAISLGEGNPRRIFDNGVSYYEISRDGDTLYIVAAAGHLFALRQKGATGSYPVYDTEWAPSYTVSKSSYFTKKYLDAVMKVGKRCDSFVNACDYDIEGSVIGTNIIKAVVNGNANSELPYERVKRMRFSTTTTGDLLAAYDSLNEFDKGNFLAGEARHIIDWMWGINVSRALMRAIYKTGQKRIMSIGRVQGPTLAILAKRELEIKEFKERPYWKLFMSIEKAEFENTRGEIFAKKEAEEALKRSKSGKTMVEKVEKSEQKQRPFPPFDLTSMQLEASRVFRIDPSRTLAIAQSLYEKSYISYPRTSSQKLPYALNLPRIIGELAKNSAYAELAKSLIASNRFRPAEGAKSDEAHPAIFPTGVIPKGLNEEEGRIYELVVKRFLACFAEWAAFEATAVLLNANGEHYQASGRVYLQRGWMDFYKPYYAPEEKSLPLLREGMEIKPDGIGMKEGKTKPPRRYTKASLISALEKKDLGTKATRAGIIDTLFKREYLKNQQIEVTRFGMGVYNALSRYSPEILDEEMTRKLEHDMESIQHSKSGKEEVIAESKRIIGEILKEFERNEQSIGSALKESIAEEELANSLGKCPKDGGELLQRKSAAGKSFAACSNWPKCDASYPLPRNAKIVPTGKYCSICHTPIVKVFRYGKRVFEMDLDPNCPSKEGWGKPAAAKPGGEKEGEGAAKEGSKDMAKGKEAAEKHPSRPRKAKSTKSRVAKK